MLIQHSKTLTKWKRHSSVSIKMLNFNSEGFPSIDQDLQLPEIFRDLPYAQPEVRGLAEENKMAGI